MAGRVVGLKRRLLRISTRTLSICAACLSAGMTMNTWAQDCSDVTGNLVVNCGFDTEIPPWIRLFGTSQHDPVEGYLAPGSASLTGGVTGNGFEVHLHQCITPVLPEVTYTFSGAIRGGDDVLDMCELFIATRSMSDCSGGGTFSDTEVNPLMNSWLEFPPNELTTLAGTVAVSFQVRCVRAAGNFSVHFDDAYFGIPPFHTDGFESEMPNID